MKIEILNPIRAYVLRIYFPARKLQECRGSGVVGRSMLTQATDITGFDNYCTPWGLPREDGMNDNFFDTNQLIGTLPST